MNILIVHEIDWIEKVIFEPHHLAELLSLKGNKVFVMDCREPKITKIKEGFHTCIITNFNRIYSNANLTLIRPPALLIKGFNRLSYFLFYERIVRKFLNENKIDVVLLYSIATSGIQTLKAAKENKIPVIFRALDIAHELINIPIVKQIAKHYEKSVISNSRIVLTTTPDLSRYVTKMGAKKNTEVLNLGINFEIFKPLIKDKNLLKKFGFTQNDKIVVFMGTLYSFSGLDNIIQNFDLLKKRVDNVKLLIVGGGPSFKNLKLLVKKKKLEKDVRITGFLPQNEIPKHISLAEICINPFLINQVTDSILPTKILEYFACSKPVLSTPSKGTVELLSPEETGITYSSTENFLNSLIDLFYDESKYEKSKKGYEYVKKNHDWKNISDILSQKLANLVKNSQID